MGFKYAIRSDKLHFLTHTVVDWIDLFTRRELANVIVDSLNHCVENKGLEVYVWCLNVKPSAYDRANSGKC